MLRGYRELKVWQRSMDLVEESYRLTATFPKHELYGITSQLRRAAVSVAANIAEGHGREHLGEYLHFLSIANGSLMELETHLLIGRRMNYIAPADRMGFYFALRRSDECLQASSERSNDDPADTRHPTPDTYSVRNATTGSIRVVAWAGMRLANADTPIRTAVTATSVAESVGVTS
jgi:four helix bundle protein